MRVITYDQSRMLWLVFSQSSEKNFNVHTAAFDRNHKYADHKLLCGKFCLFKSVLYVYKKS